MKKIFTIILCICAVTVQAQKMGNEALRKLQMAEFAIANLYVDSVDENKLVEEAIIKMLAQLDPHSTYNDAEEVKKMNEPLQGNFEGIGVQFQMIEDTLLVVQPVSNGPSEKVGILAGDRIIAVNDSAIAGVKMHTEDIMSRLRGEKGSEVKLTIVRRGVNEPLFFTVKRDKIPILSLDAAYMIQPRTGYIRINRFGATTAEEFLKALKELQKKGMQDLILDLQGNGGGYLNAAIDLANEFLQQKDLIVYTEGRAARRSNFYAKGNGKNRIEIYEKSFEGQEQSREKGYEQVTPTIFALMAAVDAKDSFTFEHSENVSGYAMKLAAKMGLPKDDIQTAKVAGLLHDIGKIGIPESILKKKGKLTDEEYEVMKTHVENSIEMIHFLPNMNYVIPAVLSHHERYDGKGYPGGVKGTDIPLLGRILAVCDSFDAMVSRRAYKDALSVEYAIGELEKGKGTQFDPDVAEAFIELIEEDPSFQVKAS